jgi:hypothetical protein
MSTDSPGYQALLERVERAISMEESRTPSLSDDLILLGRTRGTHLTLGDVRALAANLREASSRVQGTARYVVSCVGGEEDQGLGPSVAGASGEGPTASPSGPQHSDGKGEP